MSILYLTPSSIGYLTQAILALTITSYLFFLALRAWRSKQVYVQTLLLASAFGMMTCLVLLLFLDLSLRSDLRLPALFLQNIVAGLCLASLLQFAYRFPNPVPGQKLEAQIILILSFLYVAWEFGFALHRFARLDVGHVAYRPPDADYPLALGSLWLLTLFLRQTVRISSGGRPQGTPLRALWRPRGSGASATQAFALVAIASLGLSIVEVFYSQTPMPTGTRELLFSLGMLFTLFTFALVYLNYLPQKTTFMVKLVGVALVTILATLGMLSWLMLPFHLHTASQGCIISDRQTLRFTPNPHGGYDVARTPFRFYDELGHELRLPDDGVHEMVLPFPFPFYGRTRREIYVSDNGLISFGEVPNTIDARYYYTPVPAIFALFVDLNPEWAESGGGMFIYQAPDRLTLTWRRMPLYLAPEERLTFQLTLYPDGAYEIAHGDADEGHPFAEQTHLLYNSRNTAWVAGASPGALESAPHWLHPAADLPFSSPDGGAVVVDYYLCFRSQLHKQMIPLAFLILGSSVLILTGFPLFLRRSLIKPLNALMEGIRQVDIGNLKVAMPVQYHDEIGLLTQSFNSVVLQLDTLMTHLEELVIERTHQLREAKLDAEAANRAKSTFIEDINHELRTPLASILVYIETLLSGKPGPLTEIQRDFLETSYENAQLLSRLIGDLLDASQSEGDKLALEVENVDLISVLSSLVQTVQPMAEEKEIQVILDLSEERRRDDGKGQQDAGAPGFIEADVQRLNQIINNLLENAIKFTPEGGCVTLALRATAAGRVLNGTRLTVRGAHLWVSDTGVGIPPADLPHIFERFYQGSNVSQATIKGAGLGLYLAKQLVEAHHGIIWAENRLGGGAIFHVWLPMCQPKQEGA